MAYTSQRSPSRREKPLPNYYSILRTYVLHAVYVLRTQKLIQRYSEEKLISFLVNLYKL